MRRNRGYSLALMLIAVMLMAVVATASARAVRLSLLTTSDAARYRNELLQVHRALSVLRNDAWQARGMEVKEARRLCLKDGQGKTIEWRVDGAGQLFRQSGDEHTVNMGPVPVTFERRGSGVCVLNKAGPIAVLGSAMPQEGPR